MVEVAVPELPGVPAAAAVQVTILRHDDRVIGAQVNLFAWDRFRVRRLDALEVDSRRPRDARPAARLEPSRHPRNAPQWVRPLPGLYAGKGSAARPPCHRS